MSFSDRRHGWAGLLLAAALLCPPAARAAQASRLHLTILSDTVAGAPRKGLAEWGYSILITTEAGSLLFDTGGQPGLVADNARALGVDLGGVRDVALSHFHPDHVGGLVALRRALAPASPQALSVAHVGAGIFAPRRLKPDGPDLNPMTRIRPDYEAEHGRFVVETGPDEILPGVWLTGPRLPAPAADAGRETFPEEQAVVIDTAQGLVVVSPCTHEGLAEVLANARRIFGPRPILAVVGGLHLAERPDAEVHEAGRELRRLGVRYALLGHCTGLGAVELIRHDMHADSRRVAASTVGASFDLSTGISTGEIAR